MSTGRRSSRLSLLARYALDANRRESLLTPFYSSHFLDFLTDLYPPFSPEKDDNAMDVDESSEDESIEDFTTKKTPSKRASLASSSSTKSKAKKSKKPSNSSEMDLFGMCLSFFTHKGPR
jgi:hypothetical protein